MNNMKPIELHEGSGRTRVRLSAEYMGSDLIVRLYNENPHAGAVALAEYHPDERRASTSVLTRYGHKDDTVAQLAAHKICRHIKKPVCAIAGIHVDCATPEEIEEILRNCARLVDRFLERVGENIEKNKT